MRVVGLNIKNGVRYWELIVLRSYPLIHLANSTKQIKIERCFQKLHRNT